MCDGASFQARPSSLAPLNAHEAWGVHTVRVCALRRGRETPRRSEVDEDDGGGGDDDGGGDGGGNDDDDSDDDD